MPSATTLPPDPSTIPPLPPVPPPPPIPADLNFLDLSGSPAGRNFVVQGTPGDDFVIGSNGNDSVSGGFGNDLLIGGFGNDTLSGGTGDDVLIGGFGNDSLSGGVGDDEIIFGVGDTVRGGPGADHFIFRFDQFGNEHGIVHVLDFNPAEGDTFWIDNPAYGDSIYQMSTMELVYGADSGNAIAIVGVGYSSWDFLGGKG